MNLITKYRGKAEIKAHVKQKMFTKMCMDVTKNWECYTMFQ